MYSDIKEINVLDILSKYKTVSIISVLEGAVSFRTFKIKMMEMVDSFLNDIDFKSMSDSFKEKSKEFHIYCENILDTDKLSIEETEKSIKDIFEKIYRIEHFKTKFQEMYENFTIVLSTLKVLDNSFRSAAEDINEVAFGGVTSVAGKDKIIKAAFSDLDSYLSIIEETQKKIALSILYRCTNLQEILLKQEQSVRSLYKHLQFEQQLLSKDNY